MTPERALCACGSTGGKGGAVVRRSRLQPSSDGSCGHRLRCRGGRLRRRWSPGVAVVALVCTSMVCPAAAPAGAATTIPHTSTDCNLRSRVGGCRRCWLVEWPPARERQHYRPVARISLYCDRRVFVGHLLYCQREVRVCGAWEDRRFLRPLACTRNDDRTVGAVHVHTSEQLRLLRDSRRQ
jgi:hypothetical protein